MAKLSKWDYRRQQDRLIHELRQQGLSLRAIARALHCSKTTVAAVLNQERIYSRIAPWLVLEESTNPEVVAQRISMLFGEVSGANYRSLFGEVLGASGNADVCVPSGGATAATLYATGIGLDCNDAQC